MKGRRKRGGKRRAALGQSEPIRTCVGCRTMAPRETLLRFVRAPDGTLAFDVRAALPGRGAWTCPTTSCISRSVERGAFRRAFEEAIGVEVDALCREVVRVLLMECQRMLGLARRTGILFPGRHEAFRQASLQPAVIVVVADDLAPRSVREAEQAAPGRLHVGPSKNEIGEALGRRPTGVLSVSSGRSQKRLIGDLLRLTRMRPAKNAAQKQSVSAVVEESVR